MSLPKKAKIAEILMMGKISAISYLPVLFSCKDSRFKFLKQSKKLIFKRDFFPFFIPSLQVLR